MLSLLRTSTTKINKNILKKFPNAGFLTMIKAAYILIII